VAGWMTCYALFDGDAAVANTGFLPLYTNQSINQSMFVYYAARPRRPR